MMKANQVLRLSSVALLLSAIVSVRAQMFATSFESPVYTSGQSALGTYGWERYGQGYFGDSQVVSNGTSHSGSQSLLFDSHESTSGNNALLQGQVFGLSGAYSVKSRVKVASGAGSGRSAELRLVNATGQGRILSFAVGLGGDGTVRAGQTTWDSLSGVVGFAKSGSFLDRWVTITITHFPAVGEFTYKVSGFGSGQSDIVGASTGFYFSSRLAITSNVNPLSANKQGKVWFDDVQASVVPEPMTIVTFSLALATVLRRRRKA